MRRVWRARTLTERFAFPTRDLLGVQDEHIGIADSNGGQLAVFAASILSATVVTFGQPIRHDKVGPEEAAGELEQEIAERLSRERQIHRLNSSRQCAVRMPSSA